MKTKLKATPKLRPWHRKDIDEETDEDSVPDEVVDESVAEGIVCREEEEPDDDFQLAILRQRSIYGDDFDEQDAQQVLTGGSSSSSSSGFQPRQPGAGVGSYHRGEVAVERQAAAPPQVALDFMRSDAMQTPNEGELRCPLLCRCGGTCMLKEGHEDDHWCGFCVEVVPENLDALQPRPPGLSQEAMRAQRH